MLNNAIIEPEEKRGIAYYKSQEHLRFNKLIKKRKGIDKRKHGQNLAKKAQLVVKDTI